MATQEKARNEQEQGMLENIGGRDESSPEPASSSAAVRIGWMGYVGGALWATVLCGAGLAAWLFFTNGN